MNKILKYIFGVIGIIMLAIAGYISAAQLIFMNGKPQVQGTVVKNQSSFSVDMGGGNVYAPLVSFTTLDGKTEQIESGVQSSPPAHRVGDIVQVVYDPKNPSDARINSPFD